MSIFQIIALCFALFMLYVVNIHKKKARLTRLEVTSWYTLWCLFIVITIFPNLLLGIAQALNFARVFDLLIVLSFAILTLLVTLSYFHQRESGRKVEEVVRKLAIDTKAKSK